MPTIYGMRLPAPSDWQEFELITRDAMQLKWDSPMLQRNGRQGQAQHGVDIYGSDQLGRPVGIQCKNTVKRITFKKIEAEVRNAEGYEGKLLALYIATTAEIDATLQKKVRLLSEARVNKGEFAIGLLYWEDIFSGLALDARVLASHYPNLVIGGGATNGSPGANRLAGLVLGYYGGFFWHFIELLFGEAGWLAQEDPEQLRTLVRMLKVNSRVLSDDDATDIRRWSESVEKLVFGSDSSLNKKEKWRQIKQLAKATEERAKYLSSLVEDLDVASFIELGRTIGGIYHAEGEFTSKRASNMHRMISALLPNAEGPLVELLTKLKDRPTYSAGPALYTFVDRELRFPTSGSIE
ncbi:putative uncharacterized protein [Burkholderiales bacterium GJ-E10]|nr:putative uncharacterized protein [Burkholderiales bacterium GJ-E10]